MDLSQYIGIFVDEARLYLEQCSHILLKLEQTPADINALHELFRTIHTIKGMAATLVEFPYFSEISQLSHAMENLLAALRNQELPVTEAIIDLLLACVDGLEQLIALVADPNQTASISLEHLLKKLEDTLGLPVQPSEREVYSDPLWTEDWLHVYSESESQKIIQASKYGKNCFELRIRLVPDAHMKSVRAQLILQRLQQHSEIIKTLPDPERLKAGEFEHTFLVSLVTPLDDQALLEEVKNCVDVEAARAINLLGETVYSYQQDPRKEETSVLSIPAFNEIELNVLRTACHMGYQVVLLGIRLFPNVVLKAARVTLIFRAIEKYGEIIKSVPSVLELEEERFGNFFELVLITQTPPEKIRQAICSIPETKNSLEVLVMSMDEHMAHMFSTDNPSAPSHPPPPAAPLSSAPVPVASAVPTPILNSTHSNTYSMQSTTPRISPLVRVDAVKLEKLLHLLDELVLCRVELTHALRNNLSEQIEQKLANLTTVSSALHALSIQLQMVSVEQIFNRFPRMVRDLAKSLGKDIELQMEGRELELDRTLIDELSNALMHMIRNAADHGLETPEERLRAGKPAKGIISLQASYERNVLRVEVRDDGRGIDTDKLRVKAVERGIISEHSALQMSHEQALRLVFAPGLSTQDTATDISGRGVGMDAVRTQIESLGGEIRIHSQRGEGTTYTILIPSQMLMLNTLLVAVQGDYYALALDQVKKVTEITSAEIYHEADKCFLIAEQESLPLFSLEAFVHKKHRAMAEPNNHWLVIVERPVGRLGLLVDDLLGEEELILKPLHLQDNGNGRELYSGATVLKNGEVALLVDLDVLARQALHCKPS